MIKNSAEIRVLISGVVNVCLVHFFIDSKSGGPRLSEEPEGGRMSFETGSHPAISICSVLGMWFMS